MPVNLRFEMAVLGQALKGGQSATIEAVPGSLVPVAVALTNIGDTPVDLAYIYSTPKSEGFVEAYFPAWAIVSTSIGGDYIPQLLPGQNIQAVANFRIPGIPGQAVMIRFESEAFILPSGQSVHWSSIKLTLRAQVFNPGLPPPPPSVTPGSGVPIWLFIAIPALLLLPIVVDRDKERT